MIGDDAEADVAALWRPASKAFSCKRENTGLGKRQISPKGRHILSEPESAVELLFG